MFLPDLLVKLSRVSTFLILLLLNSTHFREYIVATLKTDPHHNSELVFIVFMFIYLVICLGYFAKSVSQFEACYLALLKISFGHVHSYS